MRYFILTALNLAGCGLAPKHHEESDNDKGLQKLPCPKNFFSTAKRSVT